MSGTADRAAPPLRALLAAIVACLAATGAIALLGAGSGEPSGPTSARGLPHVDGMLVVVEDTRLVLRPAGGGVDVTFRIRPEDAAAFDIPHLRSHMSAVVPTRIYYDDEGTTRYAVDKGHVEEPGAGRRTP